MRRRGAARRWALVSFALVMAVGAFLLIAKRAPDTMAATHGVQMRVERDVARTAAQKAVDAAPRDPDRRLQLARVVLDSGDAVAAEAEIRTARRHGATPETTRHLLAAAIFAQGEPDRARAELDAGPVATPFSGAAAWVRGRIALEQGDVAGARNALDVAVRAMPRDAGLWVDIARFRARNFDIAGARDAVDYAIAIDPHNVAALVEKAGLVRVQEGLAPALGWYERALAIAPDDVPALNEFAATLGDTGRYGDMLSVVRRIVVLDPDGPRPFLLQAVVAARAGNYALARSLLQRTEGRLDHEPATMLLHAIVELELGGGVVAADWADKLIAEQPRNSVARRLRAAADWATGDAQGVLATLDPFVSRADADVWSLELAAAAMTAVDDPARAATLLSRAETMGRGDAAPFAEPDPYGVVRAGAGRAPLNPDAVIPAMRTQITTGNTASARAAAERLLAANRGVADAHVLVGDAAMAQRDWGAAIRAFRDARRLNASPIVALRLIHAQYRAGDPAGAAATIAHMLVANPSDLTAERLAAHLAMDMGRYAEAAARFDRVRARVGNRDVVLLREAARARLASGAPAAAAQLAERAYRLAPANRELTVLYGDTLVALGVRQEARDLFEKAVAMMPGDKAVRARLNALDKAPS